MRIAAIAFTIGALFLNGCASLSPGSQSSPAGQAAYQYSNKLTTLNENGKPVSTKECAVTITSGRDIASGSLTLSKECDLTAQAAEIKGIEAQKAMFDAVSALVSKLPSVPTPIPKK